MSGWREIVDRAVRRLGARAGEVIQVREHHGRFEVVLEMALAAMVEELRRPIERALDGLGSGRMPTHRHADGTELRMDTTGRHWLADDGLIDADDRRRGGHVGNLPAGS